MPHFFSLFFLLILLISLIFRLHFCFKFVFWVSSPIDRKSVHLVALQTPWKLLLHPKLSMAQEINLVRFSRWIRLIKLKQALEDLAPNPTTRGPKSQQNGEDYKCFVSNGLNTMHHQAGCHESGLQISYMSYDPHFRLQCHCWRQIQGMRSFVFLDWRRTSWISGIFCSSILWGWKSGDRCQQNTKFSWNCIGNFFKPPIFPPKVVATMQKLTKTRNTIHDAFIIHLVFSWIFLIRYILFIHFSIQL